MTQLRSKLLFLCPILLIFGIIPAHAQNDIAVSGLGSFSNSTSGTYTHQNPFDQAGVLVELRHIATPLFGYEVAYSANRANQLFTDIDPHAASCTQPNCTYLTQQVVRAFDHEVTASWVMSLPLDGFRPFVLAGGGVNIFEPTGGQTGTQSDTKAVGVYGVGLDWEILARVGLRFQYRGNIYKAPDLAMVFPATNELVHNAEPAIGIFIRF